MNTWKRLPIWILALGIAGCTCFGVTAQSIPSIDGVILLLSSAEFEDSLAALTVDNDAAVAVFGQLTAGGDPIPGSGFVIAVNFMGAITFPSDAQTGGTVLLTSKADGETQKSFVPIYIDFGANFPDADGVEICYFVGSTKIITFSVRSSDLLLLGEQLRYSSGENVLYYVTDLKWFWLTELPVDPPGEAGVAFF